MNVAKHEEKETHIEPVKMTFEKAFERLESILEQLNSQHPGLEDALKVYEEADRLIAYCNKKLNDAERKVETLIKNRNGQVQLGPDGKPITQDFIP